MSKLKRKHCFNKNFDQLRLAQMVSAVSVGNLQTKSFPSTPPGGDWGVPNSDGRFSLSSMSWVYPKHLRPSEQMGVQYTVQWLNATTSSRRNGLLKPPNPSNTWLQLQILSVKLTSRTNDKGQPWLTYCQKYKPSSHSSIRVIYSPVAMDHQWTSFPRHPNRTVQGTRS